MRQYAELLVQVCYFWPPPCHIYSYPETPASQWGRNIQHPVCSHAVCTGEPWPGPTCEVLAHYTVVGTLGLGLEMPLVKL